MNYQLLSFLNLGKYIIREKKTNENWRYAAIFHQFEKISVFYLLKYLIKIRTKISISHDVDN